MAEQAPVTVTTDEVKAFRLSSHHLTHRVPVDHLIDVVGRCGIQNSPPGSALLALHARVQDLSADQVEAAVAEEKTLLQSWCMRGVPYFFPTRDVAVFTTGVLPPTEAARDHFLPGVVPTLAELDLSLIEAVALCRAEIEAVLSGRRLAIQELGEELAAHVGPRLTPAQRAVWEAEGPYAPGQPAGEGVVHFCLRILTLQQVVCFAPRAGNKALFVLVDEWLDEPLADVVPELARAELLRRFLHCYGPSTPADLAAWLGVRPGDTGPWWDLLQGELTPVDFAGRSWILTDDLEALRSTPRPEGVRLLPPRDPYTQLRDRRTILDRRHHQEVWKAVGEPGVVLVDGDVVGTWRPRKRGRTLTITVDPFTTFGARGNKLLLVEAEQVATLRGASDVEVVLGPEPHVD